MPNVPLPYVAVAPGDLPDDGPLTVAQVTLPDGHRVHPDPTFSNHGAPAALWITNEVVPDTAARWSDLARAFPSTGLWPILLDTLHGQPSRPWDDGELGPSDAAAIDRQDVAELLAEGWEADDEELLEMRAPVADETFPGLTVTDGWPARAGWPDDIPPQLPDRRLGLVAVTRPADVPAVIGWTGPANCYDSMAPVSAVLRSWEDRFGAVLVELGFDTMIVAVQRPPATMDDALRVTAEHEMFCSDNIWQGVGSYEDYARELVDSPAWSFWWD